MVDIKNKKSVKEYDAKEFAPCDMKIILLGDSAVGKSKYASKIKIVLKRFRFIHASIILDISI